MLLSHNYMSARVVVTKDTAVYKMLRVESSRFHVFISLTVHAMHFVLSQTQLGLNKKVTRRFVTRILCP